jgi:hypothetical protein
MSALGHRELHFVSTGEQRRLHCEAKRFRSLDVRPGSFLISFVASTRHAGFFNAAGSTGILRRRFPVAANIALAMAGTTADVPVSPIPLPFKS